MRRPAIMICCLVLAFFLAACGRDESLPHVRLQTDERAPVAGPQLGAGKLPLRVAVAAVLSPKATFDTYGPMLDYLSRALNRPVELLQRSTYAELNELIRTGEADVAFVCGGAFVEGEQAHYMELLAVPEVGGLTTYQALIIVSADSPAQSLEDLRGARFAFTDPLSNSGHLYVLYYLWQRNQTPEQFFREMIFTFSHDNSIRAVADGIVDGASVDSLVYDFLTDQSPDIVARTKVVLRSPPFGIPPVVVHPDLDPILKTELQDALMHMDMTEDGRAALRSLHVDGFREADAAMYDTIREMAAPLRSWREIVTSPAGGVKSPQP